MKNFKTRFRFIYVPFLVVALGFIASYSLLNYILVIRLEMPLNEDVVNIWLAFVLPWVPLLIWLRPRIKVLILQDKKGNLPGLYLFVAWLAIAAPTILTQTYLPKAVGQLTVLNKISEIKNRPLTRYYELKRYFIDKRHVAVYKRSEVTGKNSEYLTFYIDVACPIFDSIPGTDSALTLGKMADGWLGIEFSHHLSNNISDEGKENEFRDFGAQADTEFMQKNLHDFVYLDRIAMSNRKKGYLKALNKTVTNLPTKPIIFEAVNAPFEARNGDTLGWIFKAFGIGGLVWLIMILIPKLNTAEIDKLPENALAADISSAAKSLSVFNYSSRFQITAIIVGLNMLVFLVMVFAGLGFISFDGKDLLNWGADFRPLVAGGQWWRLITCVFVHGGLMHLLMNMYGLFFAAIFLEPVLGKLKYASAYFACGILSSLASIWWHPATVSVGASGAIFGLYGVLTALLTTNKIGLRSKKSLLIFSLFFIGINLVLGLRGGIDNAAHIGGLLSGLVMGYLYSFFGNLPDPDEEKTGIETDEQNTMSEQSTV